MKNTKTKLLGASTLILTFLVSPLVGLAADAKPYPLDTCIVSGEKLGEMGKPHSVTYQGQEIKFCCKDCVKDFNKAPEKYLKKLNAHDHCGHEGHAGHEHQHQHNH